MSRNLFRGVVCQARLGTLALFFLIASVTPAFSLPTIVSVQPSAALQGSGPVSITVTGQSFTSTAKVQWDGSNLQTSYVNSAKLVALVPGDALATGGTHAVTVYDNGTSNPASFTAQVDPVLNQAIVIPNNGLGTDRVFRFVYKAKTLASTIGAVEVLFGPTSSYTQACAVLFDPASNTVSVANATGQYLASAPIGGPGVLSGNACSVDVSASAITASGAQELLNLKISLNPAVLGAASIYTRVASAANAWYPLGSWTVAKEIWPVYKPTDQDHINGLLTRATFLENKYEYHSEMVNYGPLSSYFNYENYTYFYTAFTHDAQGIPYYSAGVYHPVVVAQYGLHKYGRYLNGTEPAANFLLVADKLIALQQPDGSYPYPFDFAYGAHVLPAGWTSSMAQGEALSLFARAYSVSHDPKYLDAGNRSLDYLIRERGQFGTRGTLQYLDPSLRGWITFEEYDMVPFANVLNGFEYTELGLYDWAAITGNLVAQAYFQAGADTLAKALPYFDVDTWTLYDVRHLTDAAPLHYALTNYQEHHIVLQDAMAAATGNAMFAQYRDKWIAQITSPTYSLPPLPQAIAVAPSGDTGSTAVFSFLYRHPSGAGQIRSASGIIGTAAHFAGSCGFTYDVLLGQLLVSDGTNTYKAIPGTQAVFSIPACSVDVGKSSVLLNGTDLTVNVAVAFKAGFEGAKSIFMTATDKALNIGFDYFVRGTWTVCTTSCPPATVSLSTTSVAIGNVGLNVPFTTPLTLVNRTLAPVSISSIAAAGPGFSQANNCPSVLGQYGRCTINATFSPQVTGSATGQITVVNSSATPVLSTTITAAGMPAAMYVYPPVVAAGRLFVGDTYSKTFSITNYTAAPVTFSSIALTGSGWSETDDCPHVLPMRSTCRGTLTYAPAATGTASGSVKFVSDTSSVLATITLSGSADPVAFAASRTSLVIGNVGVGSPFVAPITLSNSTKTTVSLGAMSISGAGFSVSDNCNGSLVSRTTCTVNVTFLPSAKGVVNGTLVVPNDSAAGAISIPVSATGTAPLVPVSSAVTLGTVTLGDTRTTTITITSYATKYLLLSSIHLANAPGFSETDNCVPYLYPRLSCQVTVTFAPTAIGSVVGTLTIVNNSTAGNLVIPLSAVVAPGSVTASRSSLAIGNVGVGSSFGSSVTITNNYLVPVNIGPVAASAAGFSVGSNCNGPLAARASCTVPVSFSPLATGAVGGTLSIPTDSATGTVSFPISGAGVNPVMSVWPLSVAAGTVPLTSTFKTTISLTNYTASPVSLAIGISGTGWSQTNNCPASLSTRGQCQVVVTFAPGAPGSAIGSLTVANSSATPNISVPLIGNGQ